VQLEVCTIPHQGDYSTPSDAVTGFGRVEPLCGRGRKGREGDAVPWHTLWPCHCHSSAYRSVLLFKQAGELERVEKEINVRLQGIGLSLVNDKQHKEIAYMGISRSATVIILSTAGYFFPFTCGILSVCLIYVVIHVVFCTILSADNAQLYALLKWFNNSVMTISILHVQALLSVHCLVYLL